MRRRTGDAGPAWCTCARGRTVYTLLSATFLRIYRISRGMFLTTHPPLPTGERTVHEAIFAVYAAVWVVDVYMGGQATLAIWIYTAATATLSVLWRMSRPRPPPAKSAAWTAGRRRLVLRSRLRHVPRVRVRRPASTLTSAMTASLQRGRCRRRSKPYSARHVWPRTCRPWSSCAPTPCATFGPFSPAASETHPHR